MGELTRFTVTLDSELLEQFDELVSTRGTQSNRSETVRDLVRDALVQRVAAEPDAQVAGTVTMVYDHHASDLSDTLNDIQHRYVGEIVSTLHIHLDAHSCLEVIVVRGTQRRVRAIADELLGTKGVSHGELVLTAVVEGPNAHPHQHPHPHD